MKAIQPQVLNSFPRAAAAEIWLAVACGTPTLIRKNPSACRATALMNMPWPCEPRRKASAMAEISWLNWLNIPAICSVAASRRNLLLSLE